MPVNISTIIFLILYSNCVTYNHEYHEFGSFQSSKNLQKPKLINDLIVFLTFFAFLAAIAYKPKHENE